MRLRFERTAAFFVVRRYHRGMNDSQSMIAEVVAVGDEMTSGQRLDTNSQWLAQQLNDLGIEVAYHSTVGDDLGRQTAVIRTALDRANVVVMTGGLGPTKDDLTRQAIADAAAVELDMDDSALAHIESIFARYKREMSPANRQQALYPRGGKTIHNEEGTAPGVDFSEGSSRIFAMPGVPYEMKLMWESYVADAIVAMSGSEKIIRHHVLRCFGIGESQAESMMPDLINRDREPRVGITASFAVISFRITATGETEQQCADQIESTSAYIRETLGEVVFGENEDQLSTVTTNLLADRDLDVSFIDFQFGSAAASLLREGSESMNRLRQFMSIDSQTPQQWIKNDTATIEDVAIQIREQFGSKVGIAIGRLDAAGENFPVAISLEGSEPIVETFRYGGHSSMRSARSANQVINFLRRSLLAQR